MTTLDTRTARRQGRDTARQRRVRDALACGEVDALILRCAIAGMGYDDIREALTAARAEAAGDGLRFDERGELAGGWPY